MILENKIELEKVNTLICGKPGSGKGFILKKWITELNKNGENVTIINPYGEYSQFVYDAMDPKTASEVLTNLANKQFDVAKEINRQKCSYNNLKDYKPPIIVIDSIDYYMEHPDYKSCDNIKTALYSLSSMSTLTGVALILVTQRGNGGSVPTVIMNRMENIMLLGPVSQNDDIFENLFLGNIRLPIQEGYGIIQTRYPDRVCIFKKDPSKND